MCIGVCTSRVRRVGWFVGLCDMGYVSLWEVFYRY